MTNRILIFSHGDVNTPSQEAQPNRYIMQILYAIANNDVEAVKQHLGDLSDPEIASMVGRLHCDNDEIQSLINGEFKRQYDNGNPNVIHVVRIDSYSMIEKYEPTNASKYYFSHYSLSRNDEELKDTSSTTIDKDAITVSTMYFALPCVASIMSKTLANLIENAIFSMSPTAVELFLKLHPEPSSDLLLRAEQLNVSQSYITDAFSRMKDWQQIKYAIAKDLPQLIPANVGNFEDELTIEIAIETGSVHCVKAFVERWAKFNRNVSSNSVECCFKRKDVPTLKLILPHVSKEHFLLLELSVVRWVFENVPEYREEIRLFLVGVNKRLVDSSGYELIVEFYPEFLSDETLMDEMCRLEPEIAWDFVPGRIAGEKSDTIPDHLLVTVNVGDKVQHFNRLSLRSYLRNFEKKSRPINPFTGESFTWKQLLQMKKQGVDIKQL